MKKDMERLERFFDDIGISADIKENSACVEFWTDTAEQDIVTEFDYDGTVEGFIREFSDRAIMYDVDDEVELCADMRGKNGVPSSIRTLLDDCQEAKDTLMDIAVKLQGLLAAA